MAGPLSGMTSPPPTGLEALPVGNGSLGGMIFGGADKERIQFNEQTLWTGDEIKMGNYQPFGDLFIDSPDLANATGYRRELDLSEAVHRTIFTSNGVKFTREVFSSHPDKVMVIRLSADKPGSISGTIRLTDMHKAKISASGNTITSTGSLENGLAYESRVKVLRKREISVNGRQPDSRIEPTPPPSCSPPPPTSPTARHKTGAVKNPRLKLDRILAAASEETVRTTQGRPHRRSPGALRPRESELRPLPR